MTVIKKKYFLTTKALIPHVKELISDIETYTIIEIDPRKSLQEIVVAAKLFKNTKEAKKNGFKGEPEAALVTYELVNKTIVILV